jgi:hypothetical protein
MNSELTESVQQSIRPGEMVDTYYYGDTNVEKQAFPCVVNQRFVQQLTNLGAGTSQLVISPNQGVSDIVLYMKLPANGQFGLTNDCSGFQLVQSWGAALIKSLSVRYGSSAQYFFTGAQIWLQNCWDSEDSPKRDQLVNLAGTPAVGGSGQVAGAEAYVYLNLPHNSPRADGKPLPFPSDLLVQPIVLTLELNPISAAFIAVAGGGNGTLPTQLAAGQVRVKQELMQDSADLLARRVDMNSHAYTFPLKYFAQQETQVTNLAGSTNAAAPVSVNLTGFRAGEVRNILLWLTKASDVSGEGPFYWRQMGNVQLTYNGEIFYQTTSAESQMWNLITDTKEAGATIAAPTAANAATSESFLTTWVDVPFAQVNVPYDKESKLCHGKPILNAVVNISFTTPDVASAPDSYTLHAVYLYNSSLLCSRGSSEYIF